MADELLDIVDSNDVIIGKKTREEVYAQKLCNFRVVNAFLINNKDQLWIPRRSPSKRIFPLCLDASMGGHVVSGETYDQAFAREIMEELRIDIHTTSYALLGKLNPYHHKTSAFMHVYMLKTNDVPDYNSVDFIGYYWLTSQQLLDYIASGAPCKDDLPKIVRHLLMH